MKTFKQSLLLISLIFILFSCEDLFEPPESSDVRDKIVDVWTCLENSQIFKSIAGSYTVEISKSETDSIRVYIENFYNLDRTKGVYATMNNKKLTITNQNIDDFIINGTGTISNNYNVIEWTYSVELPNGEVDNVTATYERK